MGGSRRWRLLFEAPDDGRRIERGGVVLLHDHEVTTVIGVVVAGVVAVVNGLEQRWMVLDLLDLFGRLAALIMLVGAPEVASARN